MLSDVPQVRASTSVNASRRKADTISLLGMPHSTRGGSDASRLLVGLRAGRPLRFGGAAHALLAVVQELAHPFDEDRSARPPVQAAADLGCFFVGEHAHAHSNTAQVR